MCSPDAASIIVITVMAVSGCCGVFVWISLFLGCTYLLCKWKSRKHNQPRRRRPIARAHSSDDEGGHNTHHNVPPGPPVPTAFMQPMTVYMPVYTQGTLMTHHIQPVASGSWLPSVDETNSNLYRNRTMQQNVSSRSGLQQSNPVYSDDGESSDHDDDDDINSPPPDYNSLI